MSVRTWPLLKRAFRIWSEHGGMRSAAAVAFYAMMSLAPMLVVALNILSLKFGHNAETEIGHQVNTFVGSNQAASPSGAIREMLHLVAQSRHGPRASIISFCVAIVSGSTLFVCLQDLLNDLWDVRARPGLGIIAVLRKRIWAGLMLLFAGFLLLGSFALSAALSIIVRHLGPWVWGISYFADSAASFTVAILLFASVYKVLPDVKVDWGNVWLGATITAVLFILGKFALTFYFRFVAVQSAYGAAGSLAALLIWIYYSAALMFLGAAFTRAHAESRGTVPLDDDAVRVTS